MKRFKSVTMGGVLIMGRKTFDSMGRRKLPGRQTIVVSRVAQEGVDTAHSIEQAVAMAEADKPIWIIGGSDIYELGTPLVDEVDLTVVTDFQMPSGINEVVNYTPFMQGMRGFTLKSEEANAEDPTLVHRLYVRS
jgi:dihydrofolate reductase